jgi:hypothetical protein
MFDLFENASQQVTLKLWLDTLLLRNISMKLFYVAYAAYFEIAERANRNKLLSNRMIDELGLIHYSK